MQPPLTTFPCYLCPRKYTRAFNLRNHLRTHRDEQPFICGVCGRAFTRNHDRKTHEQLHSGVKNFVCRGQLENGEHWGCGRRFARASNLGRHFRSDMGRRCMKPLLDEETARANAATELTDTARRRQEKDYMLAPTRPVPQQANAEHSAATTLTDIANTLDTGAFSGVLSARPNVSQAAAPAPVYNSAINVGWNFVQDLVNRSDTQATSSANVLDQRERIQLLEKILRDKGFDVDVELNSELRKAEMPPTINIQFAPPGRTQ